MSLFFAHADLQICFLPIISLDSPLAELEANDNNNNNNNNNNNGYNGNNNNNNNGNNNNNYNSNLQYYVGPTCSSSDGKSIHLQVYSDQTCTTKASNSIYATINYGNELPFSKSSDPIVPLNECMSCMSVDNDNNDNNNNNNNNGNNGYNGYNGYNGNNNNNNAEATELCQQSYESAARCEKNMDIYYPDTSGCDYINNILPRLSNASRAAMGSGSANAAKTFAWLFGISTIVFGAYAYFLYRKIKRGSVNLSSQEGSLA
jgi:hypothetical protein